MLDNELSEDADVSMTVQRDPVEGPQGLPWIIRDITGFTRAKEALEESTNLMEAIFNNAFNAMVVANDDMRYVDANLAACRMLGYSRDELLQLSILDVTAPEARHLMLDIWRNFIGAKKLEGEIVLLRKDGIRVEIEFRATANFVPGLHLSSYLDVTQRKREEDELRHREQEFRVLAENNPDRILRIGKDFRFLYANPSVAAFIGIPACDLVGKTMADLGLPHDVVAKRFESYRRVFETGQEQTYEYSVLRHGEVRYIHTRVVPEFGSDGKVESLLAIARDVTNLRRREQEIRALVEHSPDMIKRLDRELRHIYVNPAAASVMGIPVESIIGQTSRELGTDEKVAGLWEAALEKVFNTGHEEAVEYALTTTSGKRYYHSRLVPEFGPGGTVQTVLSISRDITERQQAEELRESITSLVSHELRTPLTNIRGYSSSLLQPDVQWSEETRLDFIRTIDREAERMSRLIEDILEMTRIQSGGIPLHRKVVSPDTVVGSAIRQASPFLANHKLSTDISPDLPQIYIDTGRIEQVMVNLLQNARKYSPDGSPIRIEAATAGKEVIFSVVDSGVGIAPEHHNAVFMMFTRIQQADKPQPSGTGLGLALCKTIVSAHGGRVWVESEAGQGATFRFTLPAAR